MHIRNTETWFQLSTDLQKAVPACDGCSGSSVDGTGSRKEMSLLPKCLGEHLAEKRRTLQLQLELGSKRLYVREVMLLPQPRAWGRRTHKESTKLNHLPLNGKGAHWKRRKEVQDPLKYFKSNGFQNIIKGQLCILQSRCRVSSHTTFLLCCYFITNRTDAFLHFLVKETRSITENMLRYRTTVFVYKKLHSKLILNSNYILIIPITLLCIYLNIIIYCDMHLPLLCLLLRLILTKLRIHSNILSIQVFCGVFANYVTIAQNSKVLHIS